MVDRGCCLRPGGLDEKNIYPLYTPFYTVLSTERWQRDGREGRERLERQCRESKERLLSLYLPLISLRFIIPILLCASLLYITHFNRVLSLSRDRCQRYGRERLLPASANVLTFLYCTGGQTKKIIQTSFIRCSHYQEMVQRGSREVVMLPASSNVLTLLYWG